MNFQKPIQSPTSIKSYNAIASQIQSERVQKQYVVQHVKWGQLRHKLKSMKLNKISVTSYLNQHKKNQGQRIDFSVRLDNDNDNEKNGKQRIQDGKQSFVEGQGINDPEKVDLFKAQMKNYVASTKLYSSKNKVKPVNKIKGFSPLTPYFSFAYQLQRNRPSTQQNSHKKQEQFEQKLFPKTPVFQSQCEAQGQEIVKRKRIGTSACSSNRGKNNITQVNTNNKSYRLKSTHSKIMTKNNDLAQFSQLTSQDYHLRVIIRRRSNVVGDCIQAIQAAIIKKKMLLFTAVVTSGQANYFADIKIKPPTDIFNDNCDPCKPISEFNTKLINHTSTGSHEMRLLLGPHQIMEYVQMFGFSSHPLQLQASTRKLGVILVDFLSITDKGLRLDKNQLFINFNNLNAEGKNSAVEQLQKLLKSNQLIRWKNMQNKKHKNRDRDQKKRTKNSRNNLSHHQIYEHCIQSNRGRQISTDYYRIYGHPHPILNSKQYEKIQSYEKLQNQQQKENLMKDQSIEQSMQKNEIKGEHKEQDKGKDKDKDKDKEKKEEKDKQVETKMAIEENLSKIQSVRENIQVETISVGEDIKESKCMEVEEIFQHASQ